MADFPESIKTFTNVTDFVDDAEAVNINPVYDEITAIDTWLKRTLAIGHNATTLDMTTDLSLSDTDDPIWYLNPTTNTYQVNLPAASTDNHIFYVRNTNAAIDLDVYSGTDTLATVDPETTSIFISDALTWSSVSGGGGSTGTAINNIQNGRLTLETGVAVSTADQADKVTLYFTPFRGNQASVYVGAAWSTIVFAELSLNITAYMASKLYDIWLYSNSGNLALDSTVWTNDTTRATAIVLQDGIYVKNGDATRKYVGTILMDAASKCQDKVTLRNVWNYYNRVGKSLYVKNSANHTYNGAERLWNNSSTDNYLQFITGVNDEPVTFINWSSQKSADASYAITRIKIDANYFGGVIEYGQVENWNAQYLAGSAQASAYPGVGKHYVQIHEASNSASSTFNITVTSGTIQG